MGQMLVRQLNDETVRLLKERAKRNKRSAEAEVRAILDEAMRPEKTQTGRRKSLLELAGSAPSTRTQDEIDAYVRSLRDEWER